MDFENFDAFTIYPNQLPDFDTSSYSSTTSTLPPPN